MSTAVDVSGEIDSPPVETKNEKTLDMASWANLGLTGNVRDVVTQQVINYSSLLEKYKCSIESIHRKIRNI